MADTVRRYLKPFTKLRFLRGNGPPLRRTSRARLKVFFLTLTTLAAVRSALRTLVKEQAQKARHAGEVETSAG